MSEKMRWGSWDLQNPEAVLQALDDPEASPRQNAALTMCNALLGGHSAPMSVARIVASALDLARAKIKSLEAELLRAIEQQSMEDLYAVVGEIAGTNPGGPADTIAQANRLLRQYRDSRSTGGDVGAMFDRLVAILDEEGIPERPPECSGSIEDRVRWVARAAARTEECVTWRGEVVPAHEILDRAGILGKGREPLVERIGRLVALSVEFKTEASSARALRVTMLRIAEMLTSAQIPTQRSATPLDLADRVQLLLVELRDELRSRALTLAALQRNLPTHPYRYTPDFLNDPRRHRNFAHAVARINEAAGRLAGLVVELDHDDSPPVIDHGVKINHRVGFHQYLADVVIDAARAASVFPGAVGLSLSKIVADRVVEKNGAQAWLPTEG